MVGGRFYSIKNHGIFLSEKRALFLMDTWFCLVWYWMHVLSVGGSVVGGRGEGGNLATGLHGITRDFGVGEIFGWQMIFKRLLIICFF